jgi:hypothetical protein
VYVQWSATFFLQLYGPDPQIENNGTLISYLLRKLQNNSYEKVKTKVKEYVVFHLLVEVAFVASSSFQIVFKLCQF